MGSLSAMFSTFHMRSCAVLTTAVWELDIPFTALKKIFLYDLANTMSSTPTASINIKPTPTMGVVLDPISGGPHGILLTKSIEVQYSLLDIESETFHAEY